MSNNTIYSYYKVNLTKELAVGLGYLKPSALIKLTKSDYTGVDGVLCIRIDRPDLNSDGPFEYSISYSFCSPNDSFNKKKAKRICNTRANSSAKLNVNADRQLKARECSEMAVNLLREVCGARKAKVGSVKIPDWFSLSERENITPIGRLSRKKAQ